MTTGSDDMDERTLRRDIGLLNVIAIVFLGFGVLMVALRDGDAVIVICTGAILAALRTVASAALYAALQAKEQG
jgi:hypothetical protein